MASASLQLNDLFSVAGKIVVITGGGRGIGKMMAEGFACEETAKELNALGAGKCIPLQANLSSEDGCKAFADELSKREKKVDVLINNSGVVWGGDIDNHPGPCSLVDPNGGHILVNAIAPGLVPTKMTEGISLVTGSSLDDLAQFIPLQRYGHAHDMAGLAIFLSSKASSWITGMVICSDGGQIGAVEAVVGAKL
ncbi:hypothetical protein PINS_up023190 [Pythium insidiosum]|nr:hypothetical protein PINS_up023190 [Pythium insidiosum]